MISVHRIMRTFGETVKILLLFAIIVSGCGATAQQLDRRASFDLGCKEPIVEELDSRTVAVFCKEDPKKKAVYVENCGFSGPGGKGDCTWVKEK